jgi:hypothetical protein
MVYDRRGKEVVFTGRFEGFNEVKLTKIGAGAQGGLPPAWQRLWS